MAVQVQYNLVHKLPYQPEKAALILSENFDVNVTLGTMRTRIPGWKNVVVFNSTFINGKLQIPINAIYYKENDEFYCTTTSDYSPERDLLLSHVSYLCGGRKGTESSVEPLRYVPSDSNLVRVNDFPNKHGKASHIIYDGVSTVKESVESLREFFGPIYPGFSFYVSDKVEIIGIRGKRGYSWQYFYGSIDEKTTDLNNIVEVVIVQDSSAPRGMIVYVSTTSNDTTLYNEFSSYIIYELCEGVFGSDLANEKVNEETWKNESRSSNYYSPPASPRGNKNLSERKPVDIDMDKIEYYTPHPEKHKIPSTKHADKATYSEILKMSIEKSNEMDFQIERLRNLLSSLTGLRSKV